MLSVGRVMEQSAMTYATQPKSAEQVSEKKTTTLAADSTDKFVQGSTSFTPAYTKATVTDNRSNNTKSGTDPDSNHEANAQQQKVKHNDAVPQNKTALQIKNDGMKDYVRQMFEGQYKDVNKTDAMKELEEILSSFDEEEHEEDYWGAEKTANRILDFAKSLANGDETKFNTSRNLSKMGIVTRLPVFAVCTSINPSSMSTSCYHRCQKR